MRHWFLSRFLILSVIIICLPIQAQEKLPGPGDLYELAVEQYYQKRYAEAIDGFSKVIHSYPNSTLVSYSYYMLGQTFLKMGRYEEAIRHFEYYLKHYPEGDRARESEQGLREAREKVQPKKEMGGTVVKAIPPIAEKRESGVFQGIEEPKQVVVLKTASSEEKRAIPRAEEEPAGQKVTGQSVSKVGIGPETRTIKRRICAQITYLEGRNWGEVEKRIKDLKEAGVNTILFRVFQNKGDRVFQFVKSSQEEGVFFKTQYAPVIEDLLEKIAEMVHRHGMDLFAWMTTRYATYGAEKKGEYWSKHYNFETKKMEIGRGYNLFHPDVLKRLEGLFRDLGRYPIDGILFQDDLSLRHNEDFSIEANRAFLKEFGYIPHPDIFYVEPYLSDSGRYYVKGYTDQFWQWAKWKNRYLMEVAGRLMAASRESNPTLQFMVNLYFEAVLNPENGIAWFSQTLTEALNVGFDYYAIMAYHRQAMKGRKIGLQEAFELMVEVTQKALHRVGHPSQLVMKIWVLDWKTNEAVGFDLAPQKEIETILEKILKQGEVSLAFVPYTPHFPLGKLKEKWASF